MAKPDQNLFQKLTRLFRSGPVVRRKLRNLDTTIAVADKTKSSGTLLFQKSMSPTYASITANAYNLTERLMRYQDFGEMEYCIDGATRIAQLDGFVTIEELARRCAENPEYKFVVYSYDHEKKKIVPAWGKQARQTCVDHAFRVTFDSGLSIIASANHRLMLRDGSYRTIEDLKLGDTMMPFYRKDLFDSKNVESSGYRWVYTTNPEEGRHGWVREHQLVASWVNDRQLTDDEVVHHVNFNKNDNRIENLRVMSRSDHTRLHSFELNAKKWDDSNSEWIEKFKKDHARRMVKNAPTARLDVTFGRILETCESLGFNMSKVSSALDVNFNLIKSRLADHGFNNFETFKQTYENPDHIVPNSVDRSRTINDITLSEITSLASQNDTKLSLSMKLGCTVNVLDKFLWRKSGLSWMQLRDNLGFQTRQDQRGGRPKGSNNHPVTFQDVCNIYSKDMTLPLLSEALSVNKNTVLSRLSQNGFKGFNDFAQSYANHKVVSIEYHGEIPLYDLTVDGYKNFATDTVISHNTAEIASALDIYCLAPDTIIPLLNGTKLTVKELFDSKSENFEVYSFDNDNCKFVPGLCSRVVKTGTNQQLFRITFDDGTSVRLTENHLVLLTDGSYKRTKDLMPADSIRSMYAKISSFSTEDRIDCDEQIKPANGLIYTHKIVAEHVSPELNGDVHVNHKVASVIPDGFDDVFDLQVDRWHNFAIASEPTASSCIIVHNSDETCAVDDKGRSLHIYSDNEKIREILEDLFYNTINVEFNLRSWTRNLPVHKDTYIPLLDGSTLTIENLSKKMKANPDWTPWVYSVQDVTHRMVPGKVTWCDLTRKDSEIVRVWLDDGSYVDCTPDHRVTMRDGSSKEAQHLSSGESLMPFYRKTSNRSAAAAMDGYEEVYDPASGRYVYTHSRVAEILEEGKIKNGRWLVTHHNDIDKSTPRFIRAEKSQKMTGIVPSMREKHPSQAGKESPSYMNHKVDRIERLSNTSDVYCMEVLGPVGEHDRHRFMTLTNRVNYDGLTVQNDSGICLENCKYGDCFLYNDVSPEHGVINAIPIPVNEIEREENFDPNDPMAVRYRWVTLGNRTLENWEVTHFRLLGNDMFLPYGSSVIEPARRIWRQLILIEDAMLVYRVVRAPERRVFYIDVANIPPENVEMYVEQQKTALRSTQVVDTKTSRVDLRYNPLCHFGNDYIYLCDGTKKTFSDLSENWDVYKDNVWTWSLDKEQHVVPTKILWAGKTIESTKFVEVELDDGQIIRTTPDHGWLLRDGTEIKAKDLKPNDSLMPYYTKTNQSLTSRYGSKINPYVDIYDPGLGKYRSAHRISGEWKYGECKLPNVIHHVNHVKHDNRPDNLQKMTQKEHSILHADIVKACNVSTRGREKSRQTFIKTHQQYDFSKIATDCWNKPVIRKKRVDSLTLKTDSRFVGYVGSVIYELGSTAREHQVRACLNRSQDFKDYLKHLNPEFKNGFSDQLSKSSFLKILRRYNFSNLREVKDYVAANRAPLDKIAAYCETNRPTSRKHISQAFGISTYDLNRVMMRNGLTKNEFDSRYLATGGYYAKTTVSCSNCDNKYVVNPRSKITSAGRTFCGRICYDAYRASGKLKNHKVIAVRFTDWEAPAYGVTVENSTHIISTGGSSLDQNQKNDIYSGVFVRNSVDEDYFIPVRGNDSGTKIDTLAGGQNTAAVEDVAYIQKKLFAALKIPRAYLGYDESLSCLVSTTCIPTFARAGNRALTIKELSDECRLDPQAFSGRHHAYAWDHVKRKIVPGRILKAWETKQVTKLVDVVFDDGSVLRSTPEHPIMLRNGAGYRPAGQLRPGDAVMPMYSKLSSKATGDYLDGYHKFLDPDTNKWQYSHRVAGTSKYPALRNKNVIHHVNFDKLNNDPSNLLFIKDGKIHRQLHATLNKINKCYVGKGNPRFNHDIAYSDVLMTAPTTSTKKELISRLGIGYRVFDRLLSDEGLSWSKFADDNMPKARFAHRCGGYDITYEDVAYAARRLMSEATVNTVADALGVSTAVVQKRMMDAGFKNWGSFKRNIVWNLNKGAVLSSLARHGTLKAAFESDYRDRCGFQALLKYVQLEWGGIRLAKKAAEQIGISNHVVTEVRIVDLPVAVPVYDLEVEGHHNFAASLTTVPAESNNLTESIEWADNCVIVSNSKATLAQEDIRFSRTISVVQKTIISELNKLAIIHLYAHGFDSEDLQNFTLRLSNPSTIAQQQKLELWRAKFEIAGTAPEGHMSKDFVRREIWGLNDEQCKAIDDHRLKEKLVDNMIENATTDEGGDDDEGGEEDMFGGDDAGGESDAEPAGGAGEGGAEEDKGGEASGGEDLFAGHDMMSNNPAVSLMTAGDDPEDDEDFPAKLSVSNVKTPVNVQRQLDKVLYNRSRIRHHGASKTHMPDFAKMTNSKGDDDPFDNSWMKSLVKNPFGESTAPLHKTVITGDVMRSLSNMQRRFTREMPTVQSKSVLTEVAGYLEGADNIENEEVLIIDEDNE